MYTIYSSGPNEYITLTSTFDQLNKEYETSEEKHEVLAKIYRSRAKRALRVNKGTKLSYLLEDHTWEDVVVGASTYFHKWKVRNSFAIYTSHKKRIR